MASCITARHILITFQFVLKNIDYLFLVACGVAQNLNMEEAGSSETSATIYRSARRHMSGDLNLQHHRENRQTSQHLGSS